MTYETGSRVVVLNFDDIPIYKGTVTADEVPAGRVPVLNDQTGETVAVPASFVRPEGF